MDIALFDFDGTLTHQDTFTEFIVSTTPRRRLCLGALRLLPYIIGYKLGRYPASRLRPRLVRAAFAGRMVAPVLREGRRFAEQIIPTMMRDSALQRLRQHLLNGDRVVIVSASLNVYLQPLAQSLGVDLVCSRLATHLGSFTGEYEQFDCSGSNKVTAVTTQFNLAEYDTVYAYGDTDEDLPMLALADRKYFRGKPLNEEMQK